MEVKPDNIIINSCEYTPVYLIPSTSVTQAGSYILAPSQQETAKPTTDNLKRFYENSGKINGGIMNSPKPRILKKQAPAVTGNNLKLASFLLPKSEGLIAKKEVVQTVPVTNNVILKPVTTSVPVNVGNNMKMASTVVNTANTVAKVEVDRKIVRVGTIPVKAKPKIRTVPKILAKECIPATTVQANSNPLKTNHTSVQLLKLGETYHSLNQLSTEQMKIVNQALKMFSDGAKVPEEPAYDPETNTKFVYKIVSPRDLTVVGKNTIEVKQKKEVKRPIIRKIDKKDLKDLIEEESIPAEPKVTRSGRTVKLPKTIQSREETPKPRKKCNNSVVNCIQCSAEFCSLYRLQRHYEAYPTHIPAKIHSNLFHCLLAIIKSGSAEDQANIFIQQLQQLIDKLRALVPCLLKEVNANEGKMCNISEDVGRIFGLDPGKYNLNIEALTCVKDKDGHCMHNPAPKVVPAEATDDPAAINEEMDAQETEDCARINSVDKWPSVSKRMSKIKQQKSERMKAKRMRLASENNDQNIEPGTDDVAMTAKVDSAITIEENKVVHIDLSENQDAPKNESCTSETQSIETKETPVKFHSTHFDIRSSPIKSSALVKKFQINEENLPNLEVQIMRPLTSPNEKTSDIVMENDSDSLGLFRDNDLKEATINVDLNFDTSKAWPISQQENEPNESYMKPDMLFEPSLTPIKEGNVIEPSLIHIKDKTEDYFQTCEKTDEMFKPAMVEKTTMMEPSFMDMDTQSETLYHTSTKPNGLIDSALMETESKNFENSLLQGKVNGLFEETTKENIMLEANCIEVKADNFFEQILLQMGNKCSSIFDSMSPIRVKSESSLIDPSFLQTQEKSSSLFDALEHVKERSHNLFDSGIQRKDKDSLIGPSMISIKAESNNFSAPTLHGKYDILIEPMKAKGLLDSELISDNKAIDNVDISQSDCSSNQGHSVLNLLDSLGSECLSYPETEIRNHSVDFQLDLLFNSS